jgi:hypothetical protein
MAIIFYDDINLNSLMAKVNKFNHFKFEKNVTPTITLDRDLHSVQAALSYIIEFLHS